LTQYTRIRFINRELQTAQCNRKHVKIRLKASHVEKSRNYCLQAGIIKQNMDTVLVTVFQFQNDETGQT